jgi:predicted DNA-binding protein with PD1-like motif
MKEEKNKKEREELLSSFSNLKANGDFKNSEQQAIADKVHKKETLTEEELKKRKKLEILFCWGTISWEQSNKSDKKYDKAKAHAHITFAESNKKGNAFGGHLIEAKVSIVAEIIVDVMTTGKNKLGDKN